jgi:hypothetical protein
MYVNENVPSILIEEINIFKWLETVITQTVKFDANKRWN